MGFSCDDEFKWMSQINGWITGFLKRHRFTLPETQQEMLKYNTDNIDAGEIIDHLRSPDSTPKIHNDDRIAAIITPRNFNIEEERGYLRVGYLETNIPERMHELDLIDVRSSSDDEIKKKLEDAIRENPTGFAIGFALYSISSHERDVLVYVYKPVKWFGIDVNVYK